MKITFVDLFIIALLKVLCLVAVAMLDEPMNRIKKAGLATVGITDQTRHFVFMAFLVEVE